jgi:hypothetical protein
VLLLSRDRQIPSQPPDKAIRRASRTAQIGRGGPTTLYRGITQEVDVEKVTIQIPEEAISCARVLVDELRETGAAVDTANWGQMARVDENACERDERGNLWIVGDRFRDRVLAGCDVQQTTASLGRAEPAGRICALSSMIGGRGGIRTHGGHKDHNGFRDRPVRPLRHPSE